MTDEATTNDTPNTYLGSSAEGTPNEGALTGGTANEGTAVSRRGGGSRGNRNRLSHGLRSSAEVGAARLELGTLPESLHRVERATFAYRRLLEAAVTDAHGTVSVSHAMVIQTAARWERHSLLALRWLREHEAKLSAEQRLSYSREIARASAERDKAVATLKLQCEQRDTIIAYYATEAQR